MRWTWQRLVATVVGWSGFAATTFFGASPMACSKGLLDQGDKRANVHVPEVEVVSALASHRLNPSVDVLLEEAKDLVVLDHESSIGG